VKIGILCTWKCHARKNLYALHCKPPCMHQTLHQLPSLPGVWLENLQQFHQTSYIWCWLPALAVPSFNSQ